MLTKTYISNKGIRKMFQFNLPNLEYLSLDYIRLEQE